MHQEPVPRPTAEVDVFTRSVLARPAILRVGLALAVIVPLWFVILWAVSVP